MPSPGSFRWGANSAANARAAIKPCAQEGAPGQAAIAAAWIRGLRHEAEALCRRPCGLGMDLAERSKQERTARRRPRPAGAVDHCDSGKLKQTAGLGMAESKAEPERDGAAFEEMTTHGIGAR